MFTDTHFHPYLLKENSLDTVIKDYREQWWQKLISIGVDYESSLKSINYSQKYDCMYASIWVHPCHIWFDWASITELIQNIKSKSDTVEIVATFREMYYQNNENVIAIGECWLDYYWIEKIAERENCSADQIRELQKLFFKAQILLAKELWLPFIIHNRNAGKDVFDILKECNYWKFVLHCFAENYSYASQCIELFPECMFSFSGILTFKNAWEIQETAQKIPLERILIETDSPYLTPAPFRGKQENQPAFTQYVLKKIQELRSEEDFIIQKSILRNSDNFFKF